MPYLSNILSSSTTLKELELCYCNITDNGVRYICEGLIKNQALTMLNIGSNRQITSVSTSTIADLIQTNSSLTTLYLYNTSLNNDDIKTLCTSLAKNSTILELYLSRQHEEYAPVLVIVSSLLFILNLSYLYSYSVFCSVLFSLNFIFTSFFTISFL